MNNINNNRIVKKLILINFKWKIPNKNLRESIEVK